MEMKAKIMTKKKQVGLSYLKHGNPINLVVFSESIKTFMENIQIILMVL